jgi:hypothetical protein
MNEIEQPTAGFTLFDYEKLTDHGFALPCFTGSRTFNSIYVACARLSGDPHPLIWPSNLMTQKISYYLAQTDTART